MSGRNLWLALAVVAALAVGAFVVLVGKKKAPAPQPSVAVVADAGAECNAPKTLALLPLPSADDPPVILWATGDVRMELNDELVFAPPDSPKTLKSSSHKLRVEAKTAGKEETTFRVLRQRPAFFYATSMPDVGLVLVRHGTLCESCDEPTGTEQLQYAARKDSTNYLLRETAKVLRQEKWTEARDFLAGVPPKDRQSEAFRILAAALFGQANQPTQALEQLESIAKTNPKSPVAQLISGFAALKASEEKRREKVLLMRWNKLTERYSNLVSRFEPEVRGFVDRHARRLETLSSAYSKASETHDVPKQEELVRAAQELVEQFVEEIRAQKPEDCDFQSKVVAAALQ